MCVLLSLRDYIVQFSFQQNDWSTGIGCAISCYIQLMILCDVDDAVNNRLLCIFQKLTVD